MRYFTISDTSTNIYFVYFFPLTCYCWTILLIAGFWLCSQMHLVVHLVVLVLLLPMVVVVLLLRGLKAQSLVYQGQQSFNQLVERARTLLARAQKAVNKDRRC